MGNKMYELQGKSRRTSNQDQSDVVARNIFSRTSITYVVIKNKTTLSIVNTSAEEYRYTDFDCSKRPSCNLNGLYIRSGMSTRRIPEEVVWGAKRMAPFVMTLYFVDGTKDTFRINQKSVFGWDYKADFNHTHKGHYVDYFRNVKDYIMNIEVHHTSQQKLDIEKEKKAEALLIEAQEDRRHNRLLKAREKLQKALKLARGADLRRRIQNELSYVHELLGNQYQREAENFEKADNFDKAAGSFSLASYYYSQSMTYYYKVVLRQKMNDKHQAYTVFRYAIGYERTGSTYFKKNNHTSAQTYFKLAAQKYEEAQKRFGALAKLETKYEKYVKVSTEQIPRMKQAIKDLQRIMFTQIMKDAVMHEKIPKSENYSVDEANVSQEIGVGYGMTFYETRTLKPKGKH